MALTVNQQPDKYCPVGKSQIFHATSTNSGAANHHYTIKCTDTIIGLTAEFIVYGDPIYQSMVFDASEYFSQFMQYFKPLLIGGWQKATGSIRPVIVNVGETYGSTPAYYPGTDYNYVVWSGIVDFMEGADGVYDVNKYVYNHLVNNVYMAGVTNDLTFSNKSNFVYVLSNHYTGARITNIRIIGYDASGTQISTSTITNPHATGGNTYDKNFVCIDVGEQGLNALTAPQVTGTYPVLNANIVKYEVYDYDSNPVPLVLIKTITRGCENIYRPMILHYLAKNGAMQTAYFSLETTSKSTKTGQTYGINPNINTGTSYGYSISSAPIRDFGTITQDMLTLRTDWLSDDQIVKYKDLWSSPIIYLQGDINYPNLLVRIRAVTPEYRTIPRPQSRLVAWENEFYYSHQNYVQHG